MNAEDTEIQEDVFPVRGPPDLIQRESPRRPVVQGQHLRTTTPILDTVHSGEQGVSSQTGPISEGTSGLGAAARRPSTTPHLTAASHKSLKTVRRCLLAKYPKTITGMITVRRLPCGLMGEKWMD